MLGAFGVLNPREASTEEGNISDLQVLTKKLMPGHEEEIKTEWYSFKDHLSGGVFKVCNLPGYS